MTSIKTLIDEIEKKFKHEEFDKFIYDVTFPKFKNFGPNTRVVFRFPVTVVIGPNGGGKSSLLHAVWGMPLKHSTSRFWFSTPVDPINNDEKNQNRYWYSHYIKAIKQTVQSRKISGNKRHGYWEPSRPALKEGMDPMPNRQCENFLPSVNEFMSPSGDRWSPVNRTPHYFNAKEQPSAFDRFFTSVPFDSLEDRQDYFVKYSRKLKRVIDHDLKSSEYYKIERIAENKLLTANQLNAVNTILQKHYKSARYISHKFYDKQTYSPSVLFETAERSYSEAFAGSGELAVVNYVLALEGLEKYDLLLLDEPETSLHPGAQQKLIEHLLGIIKEKFIQVIISSHSPTFVQLLPSKALVVLEESNNGVISRSSPSKDSAFDRLGTFEERKITILAEDCLMKVLIEEAIRTKWNKELRNRVSVRAADVGVSEMLSNQVRAYIEARPSPVMMVLDGDQSDVEIIFNQDPSNMNDNEKLKNIDNLKKLGVGMIGNSDKVIERFDKWMRWCKKHVIVANFVCPEKVFLQLLNPKHDLLSQNSQNPTNQKLKGAVKSYLQKKNSRYDADSQGTIFQVLLSQDQNKDTVEPYLDSLATGLKVKLDQRREDPSV